MKIPLKLQYVSIKLTVLKVKVKANFALEQAMKAQMASRGIVLLFL
jgi:hypothetical protein